VQELTLGGTPTANLLIGLGIDEVFRRTDSAGARDFLTDALGSTLALTDGSGIVQTTYTYDPFGATSASGAISTNPQQFTGRETDGISLYFYRARFYSPAFQRFIREDPTGFAAGVNLYSYVSNRHTMMTDPLGLWGSLPDWFWNWWNTFWKPAVGAAAGAAGPAGAAVESVETLEEGRKILEKAKETQDKRVERDDDIKRVICETQPDLPLCKDLKKPKKSKSDDPGVEDPKSR
jgi:RHS repeat-associated protein